MGEDPLKSKLQEQLTSDYRKTKRKTSNKVLLVSDNSSTTSITSNTKTSNNKGLQVKGNKTKLYQELEQYELVELGKLLTVIGSVTSGSPKQVVKTSLPLKNLVTTYAILRDKVFPQGVQDTEGIMGYLKSMFGSVQGEFMVAMRGKIGNVANSTQFVNSDENECQNQPQVTLDAKVTSGNEYENHSQSVRSPNLR